MDVSNGVGVGVALFVQGCHFHCKGCFNPETWDFSKGKEWNDEIEEQFFELIKKPYVKRVSFLGGEPLAPENIETVCRLVKKIKDNFADKKIWIYTGYSIHISTFDRSFLFTSQDWIEFGKYGQTPLNNRAAVFPLCDYVVDGQFDISKQDIYNEHIIFAGSTNQRVINVQESLKQHKIICLE
jgi:anaerobic ribonucleoside-triphosphate reductase activating protein